MQLFFFDVDLACKFAGEDESDIFINRAIVNFGLGQKQYIRPKFWRTRKKANKT